MASYSNPFTAPRVHFEVVSQINHPKFGAMTLRKVLCGRGKKNGVLSLRRTKDIGNVSCAVCLDKIKEYGIK